MRSVPTERPTIYPPFVRDDEARRRWRLVTYAGLVTYGFEVGDTLDRGDRVLIWSVQRALYSSDLATGDGDLLPGQAAWLEDLGLI